MTEPFLRIDLSADEVELLLTALKYVHQIDSAHVEHAAEAWAVTQLLVKICRAIPPGAL